MLEHVELVDLTVPGHCHDAADTGGITPAVAFCLCLAVRVELPDATVPFQLGTRIQARRRRPAMDLLAGITGGTERHVHVTAAVERDRFGDVFVRRNTGLVVVFQNELHVGVGNQPAPDDFLAIHFASRTEIEVSAVDTQPGAVLAGVLVITEHLDVVGTSVAVGVAKRD